MERPANDGTGGQIEIYTQSRRAYLGPNIQIRNVLNIRWSEKATWCGWWWVNGKHRGGHPGDTVSLGEINERCSQLVSDNCKVTQSAQQVVVDQGYLLEIRLSDQKSQCLAGWCLDVWQGLVWPLWFSINEPNPWCFHPSLVPSFMVLTAWGWLCRSRSKIQLTVSLNLSFCWLCHKMPINQQTQLSSLPPPPWCNLHHSGLNSAFQDIKRGCSHYLQIASFTVLTAWSWLCCPRLKIQLAVSLSSSFCWLCCKMPISQTNLFSSVSIVW